MIALGRINIVRVFELAHDRTDGHGYQIDLFNGKNCNTVHVHKQVGGKGEEKLAEILDTVRLR